MGIGSGDLLAAKRLKYIDFNTIKAAMVGVRAHFIVPA
jgi:hypothetical protein